MDRRRTKRNTRRAAFRLYSPTRVLSMSAAVPLNLSALREGTSGATADVAPERGVAVSVVIPTLNEAAQIAQAVGELSWANEVIVVDGGSTDGTQGIAQAAGARVLVLSGSTIAAQRNLGIEAARNRWILALDADERATSQLRAEISQVVTGRNPTHAAYRLKFRNHYLGRELHHGPWGRDWHIRLFTNERRYVCHRVHEHLEPIEDVGTLTGPIVHHPYRDLSHHVSKIVKYARWGADDLHARGREARMRDLVGRPAWRFFRDYVVYSGWRDGSVGFVAAALSSFAAFLKYAFLFSRSRSPEA